MIEVGSNYSEVFSFSDADVQKFAEVSGDFNPLHLDTEYASKTPFKRPIIHGFLGGSIFSRILGMKFPGEGSVYLNQTMDFKRPMFTETEYEASVSVLNLDKLKNTAILETKVTDKVTGKLIISGQATIMNKVKIK